MLDCSEDGGFFEGVQVGWCGCWGAEDLDIRTDGGPVDGVGGAEEGEGGEREGGGEVGDGGVVAEEEAGLGEVIGKGAEVGAEEGGEFGL
jgi:hypothetical protein